MSSCIHSDPKCRECSVREADRFFCDRKIEKAVKDERSRVLAEVEAKIDERIGELLDDVSKYPAIKEDIVSRKTELICLKTRIKSSLKGAEKDATGENIGVVGVNEVDIDTVKNHTVQLPSETPEARCECGHSITRHSWNGYCEKCEKVCPKNREGAK